MRWRWIILLEKSTYCIQWEVKFYVEWKKLTPRMVCGWKWPPWWEIFVKIYRIWAKFEVPLRMGEPYKIWNCLGVYVVCPSSMNQPFVPFKNDKDTSIFPSGNFIGIYYGKELVYVKKLSYEIHPIKGYLFEKMDNPLKYFISSLSAKWLEDQKRNNQGMSYIYKRLMSNGHSFKLLCAFFSNHGTYFIVVGGGVEPMLGTWTGKKI